MLGKPAFTNKIVAKNLGVPEERVTKVTGFFYKELLEELKKREHPFIFVRGLGTFAMNPKTIDSMLRKFWMYRKDKQNRLTATQMKMKESMFELFRIRRLIKNKLKENKELSNAVKIVDDTKG